MHSCRPIGDFVSQCADRTGIELSLHWKGWIILIAGLLSITGQHIDANETPTEFGATSPLWSAHEVRQWATDRSPAAKMLESERAAAAAGIDRDDAAQCAQASLKQRVLAELAQHERNRAAADVLEVYYRIVGLGRQRQLLVEADAVIQRLISMADEAESLGLSNEDPDDLRREQLLTEDKLLQLDSGVKKLRLQLAQLTGHSADIADQAILMDPLLIGYWIPSIDDAIGVALSRRSDLRALQTLTQRLNAQTLPAARDVLAMTRPGLGMVTEAVRRLALPCLSRTESNAQELRYRRQQSQYLAQARAEQIEFEVRSGWVDLSTARQRVEAAHQRSAFAASSIEKRRASVDLDQAAAGSDLLVKLELLAAQGDHVQYQIDEAVASVRLRQAQGIAADPEPEF